MSLKTTLKNKHKFYFSCVVWSLKSIFKNLSCITEMKKTCLQWYLIASWQVIICSNKITQVYFSIFCCHLLAKSIQWKEAICWHEITIVAKMKCLITLHEMHNYLWLQLDNWGFCILHQLQPYKKGESWNLTIPKFPNHRTLEEIFSETGKKKNPKQTNPNQISKEKGHAFKRLKIQTVFLFFLFKLHAHPEFVPMGDCSYTHMFL